MPYYKTSQSIVENEKDTLKFWKENKIFEQSVQNRPKQNSYVLYDGPPFATGLPHYGHMLAHALKDVFPRYHTMQGKRVERRFGWDCHGVPVEYAVEQEQKINGTQDIKRMGVAEFNERCRAIVLRYTNEWRATEDRLGRFVDMDNDYKTMDPWYMESVWAVFKKIFDKGLVYEGRQVIAYSPILGTPLSDFESKLNYKTVQDPAVSLLFPLENDPNTSLLVWTTTPWTVPSNVAIAVNPALKYVQITLKTGKNVILVQNAVEKYFKQDEILSRKEIDIEFLINQRYLPMFPCVSKEDKQNAYKIVKGEFVTADDGTGLVHISPAFGEDDNRVGKEHGLPVFDFFDANGKLPKGLPDYSDNNAQFKQLNSELEGLDFKSADKPLIQYMKGQQRVFRHDTYSHEYPFCWRTESPLMYRSIPSWYVKVTAIKDRIIENNKKINWYPDAVGSKRFNNWLENARDWGISRNRYWGCPLPIWRNVNDAKDCIVIGSIKELEELTQTEVTDLHSHFIDHLTIDKDGKTYQRVPEVFDCWFESGAMPYAQDHYPFEGESQFLDIKFPADFIAEGLDQTRGWFYTLMVLSTALFDKPAFKNCVVNGIVLGDDGKKMSKSKRNYPSLDLVFDKYGADALRFVLLGSPATKAQEMAISESTVNLAVRELLIPIVNLYKFFADAANNARVEFKTNVISPQFLTNPLDQWLFYRIEMFKQKMTDALEQYDVAAACAETQKYVDDLSKWYVRNIKSFLNDKNYTQRKESLHVLFYALDSLSRCTAPVLPFTSEYLFRLLNGMEKSVHLENWPLVTNAAQFKPVHAHIEKVRDVIHLGNRVRQDNKIKLKQPLSVIYLSDTLQSSLKPFEDLICNSLNVERIEWINSVSDMLSYQVTLNAKTVGPKYRTELASMNKAIAAHDYKLEGDTLTVQGKTLSKSAGEFQVQFLPKNNVCGAAEADLWIAADTTLTPQLIERGHLREIEREVQMMRKALGLTKNDKIMLYFSADLAKIVFSHQQAFCEKTSATLLTKQNDNVAPAQVKEIEVDEGIKGSIALYAQLRAASSSKATTTRMWNSRDSSSSSSSSVAVSSNLKLANNLN